MTENQALNAWQVLISLWAKENGVKPVNVQITNVGGNKSA